MKIKDGIVDVFYSELISQIQYTDYRRSMVIPVVQHAAYGVCGILVNSSSNKQPVDKPCNAVHVTLWM